MLGMIMTFGIRCIMDDWYNVGSFRRYSLMAVGSPRKTLAFNDAGLTHYQPLVNASSKLESVTATDCCETRVGVVFGWRESISEKLESAAVRHISSGCMA